MYKIKGIALTRKVFINGKELLPAASQRIYNHSPDGFNWGYGGSGPAQLALAIMLDCGGYPATKFYQTFKSEIIAKLEGDFEIEINIIDWIEKQRSKEVNHELRFRKGGQQ